MTQFLFLFTISPVQSFIGQARKTQDLYSGSFLLSYLSRIAAKKAIDDYQADILLPTRKSPFSPNRFLAIVKASDKEKIHRIGQDIQNFVKQEFSKIASEVSGSLNLTKPAGFDKQINDFLQINWVLMPFEEGSYTEKYNEIESYLGAVKNIRIFNQLNETGRKCSLCGERNILFYRKTKDEQGKVNGEIIGKKLFNHALTIIDYDYKSLSVKKLQPGEGLCGVCFTKRCAEKFFNNTHTYNGDKYDKDFPSTAKIALLEAISKLRGLCKSEIAMADYEDLFNKDFDEQLYFEKNLTKRYFEKNGYPEDKREKANSKLKYISDYAKEKDIRLSKYYAIIIFDGDNIGKWLSGEFLTDKSKLQSFHKEAAERLGTYAGKIKYIIEPKGKLIYAGGDDMLAFVNLKHLLPVMDNLIEDIPGFEEINNIQLKYGKRFTVSCGICITHYKTPLSEALNWARKMVKEAKEIEDGNKDAVAIALMTHSGNIRKTRFKWKYSTILEEITKKLNSHFSDKFIYTLKEEFYRLYENVELDYDNISQSVEMIVCELKRLMRRAKRSATQKEDFDFDKDIKKLLDSIKPFLFSQFIEDKNKYTFSITNFISFFEIARFLFKEKIGDQKE